MSTLTKLESDDLREVVLGRCQYHVETQLWPTRQRLDYEGWLENFSDADQDLALYLLNGFTYFNDQMCLALFRAAIASIAAVHIDPQLSPTEATAQWSKFVDSALFCLITDDVSPSTADSGYIFHRMARDDLGIPPARLMTPEDCLRYLKLNGASPVIFVDDFAGSGEQMRILFTTQRLITPGVPPISFADMAKVQPGIYYYCPLLATELAREALAKECPEVHVRPAHFISADSSPYHTAESFWPPALCQAASEFMERTSRGTGIPECNGCKNDWRGFRKLGLAIAFEHGIPDACLAFFHWSENAWKPLKSRGGA